MCHHCLSQWVWTVGEHQGVFQTREISSRKACNSQCSFCLKLLKRIFCAWLLGLFPRNKATGDWYWPPTPNLAQRSSMGIAVPLLPLFAFTACYRVNVRTGTSDLRMVQNSVRQMEQQVSTITEQWKGGQGLHVCDVLLMCDSWADKNKVASFTDQFSLF